MMMISKRVTVLYVSLLVLLCASPVYASGSNMPWETPLNNILASCTGPVAKVGGILAIIATGLGIAFSEGGGLIRKCASVVFGLSLTFSAATFIADFLGYSRGFGF